MKSKTKMVRDVVKQVVDSETGEIIEQGVEKHFVSTVKSEEFFMWYVDKLGTYFGLKRGSDKDLIVAMCCMADFNTGVVHMTPNTKKKLAETAKISLSNISKNLKRLVAAKLLFEEGGDYTINPELFWKGSVKTRTEILMDKGMVFQIKVVDPK